MIKKMYWRVLFRVFRLLIPILGISSGSLQAYAICLELTAIIEHVPPG
jgi:hypothetical protein